MRYQGPFLDEDGFIHAGLEVENGEIVEFEEGEDSGKEAIVIPTPYNSHTHVGDSVVKEVPNGTIEEVVGPGGIKHRELENASEDEIVDAVQNYLEDLLKRGARNIFEFREGGIEGLKVLEKASKPFQDEIDIRKFARPSERAYDQGELDEILSMADGIGLSAYRDWDPVELEKIVGAARGKDKPLALHCSEDVREPVEDVLEFGVHHLVHMIEAEKDDLTMCVDEEVPIVICPRSNMHFKKMPDIPEMLDAGVTLSLGTDNAMISSPDMFKEMEAAYRIGRLKGGVDPLEILMMTTWNPRKALNPPFSINQNRDSYLILECGYMETAYEVVTRKDSSDIIEVVRW